MIKTYFFVPLTNSKFINKARTLQVDYLVYDLEDAISKDSSSEAYKNLLFIDKSRPCFLRPKIDFHKYDPHYLDELYKKGFNKFVIPKAFSFDHIKKILEWSAGKKSEIEFIILVENTGLLFDLQDILRSFHENINGISLGSHDYCSSIKAKYEYNSYRFAHDLILNLAAAYSVEPIDITSMEIDNKQAFISETEQGFNKGYRSKFILHPKQLDYLQEIEFFSSDEIQFAKLVAEKIKGDDFDAVKVDGKVLEKPHLQRIKEILNYIKDGTHKHW